MGKPARHVSLSSVEVDLDGEALDRFARASALLRRIALRLDQAGTSWVLPSDQALQRPRRRCSAACGRSCRRVSALRRNASNPPETLLRRPARKTAHNAGAASADSVLEV